MSIVGWDKGSPNLRSSLFLLKLGIAGLTPSLKVYLTDQPTNQYHLRRGLGLRQGSVLRSRAVDAGGGRKTSPSPSCSLSCPYCHSQALADENSNLHMHIGHVFSEVGLYTHMYV